MTWTGEERRAEQTELRERLMRVETQLVELLEKVDRVLKSLDGNGGPGLKTRLDRLEQIEKNRLWTWRCVLGSVVGLVVKAGFDLLAK